MIKGQGYKVRSHATKKKKKGGRVWTESVKDGGVVKEMILEDLSEEAMKKAKVRLDSAESYEK